MWNPYETPLPGVRRLLGAASVLVVFGAWVALSASGSVSELKLPSPSRVVEAFQLLAWDEQQSMSPLLEAMKWSLLRIAIAGALVMAIGVPIGVLMGSSPRVNSLLSPLVDPFRSAPVVAFVPLFIIWFGLDEAMKVAFLFTGAVVFLIPMVRDAMRAVSQEYWIAAYDLGATPWEAVRHAVWPMAKPRIFDAITVSISVMWTYITVAEYVNAQEGLGQLLQHAKRTSAMNKVVAVIIVIMALALVTQGLLVWLKRRLYPWESE